MTSRAFLLKGPRWHCPTRPKLAGSPSHTRTLNLQTGQICEPTWWVSSSEKEPGLNKHTRLSRPQGSHRRRSGRRMRTKAHAQQEVRAHTLRMLPELGVCSAGWGFPATQVESRNRRVSGWWEKGIKTIFFLSRAIFLMHPLTLVIGSPSLPLVENVSREDTHDRNRH